MSTPNTPEQSFFDDDDLKLFERELFDMINQRIANPEHRMSYEEFTRANIPSVPRREADNAE